MSQPDPHPDTPFVFAALGHPARLGVFRLLVRAEPQGLLVGDIAGRLDIPLSTLAHHLRSLKAAGLLTQDRLGREVVTRARTATLRDILGDLIAECCAGLPAHPPHEPTPESALSEVSR